MNFPSRMERASVSAAMSLLAPVGMTFLYWLCRMDRFLEADNPIQEALQLLLLICWFGFLPCLVSWVIGLLPFVLLGRDRPRVWRISTLAGVSAGIGACWGIGIAYFGSGWIFIPWMTLAGIGPGLGYGLWLRAKLRGIQDRDAEGQQ